MRRTRSRREPCGGDFFRPEAGRRRTRRSSFDAETNWALACRSCNLFKAAHVSGIDPESVRIVKDHEGLERVVVGSRRSEGEIHR